MPKKTKSLALAANKNEASDQTNPKANRSTAGKQQRVLMRLLRGWRGHRFDAESDLNDHCLNSTVSALQKKHGVRIQREWVKVNGKFGPVNVKKYWIDPDDAQAYLARRRVR